MRRWLLAAACALAACGKSPVEASDGGAHDGGAYDAGARDAGHVDSGEPDAGASDSGQPDAGSFDAGPSDAGPSDAGLADAGSSDAGLADSGSMDAGPGDAGFDAGPLDSGFVDAGPLDSGSDAGPQIDLCALDAGPLGDFTQLRIGEGNLSTGTHQNYDNGEGIRIFRGLNLDIATIQEFNYLTNTDADLRSMIDQAFGTCYAYARGNLGAQQIPNGIASRFPIVASGEWTDPQVSNRDFVWAQIALPGGQQLLVISVHLLTTSATNRNLEAAALVAQIQGFEADAGFDGGFVVLGGDFNTDTRTEACMTTFSNVFAVTGPYPADQLGNTNTSENRSRPHDWLIADPALDAAQVPLVIGVNQLDAGLVFDSRVYTPLVDVRPILFGDSAASGMQHMLVVREFDVANPPDAGAFDAGALDAGALDAGP